MCWNLKNISSDKSLIKNQKHNKMKKDNIYSSAGTDSSNNKNRMKELAIDIETYSETDIKNGVHKYAEDPNFAITLCAFCFDNGPIEIVDLACGEELPSRFMDALLDKDILKTAYNAAFEMTCFNKFFDYELDPTQWSCTQALAAQAGLPFGLDNVAKVLKTVEQKDSRGKDLIKYFTMPCKPTKTNGMRTRNLPHHDFDKWLDFKEYCRQDVATEQAIRQQLTWFDNGVFEKSVWALDQKINNRGVLVDLDIVRNAVSIEAIVNEKLIEEMIGLTNIENPKSNAQVKKFIQETTGVKVESLSKANIGEVNALFKGSEIAHVLKIREKLNRTSVKKFTAMLNSVCTDNRIRGLFQYYGANRTGRWAGRNVQLQNLKRNDLKDLDFARSLVKTNNLSVLELSYDDVGYVLSNLIRTAFIAKPGHKLIVSDLSAIEARIIAWFADEKWRLDVFATHGKIYEASASMMFKVPLESITKESPLRRKGKIAELALGYQGAVGALERMGGAAMGLSTDEMARLVKQWRQANKEIVKLWYNVQDAAVEAIEYGRSEIKYLKFNTKNRNLIIELPSGRKLVYINAKFDGNKITYHGMDQATKRWCAQDTYGGKLVENIVQATARDVIADIMKRLDKKDFNIIMHVHDEIVCENVFEAGMDKLMTNIMSEPLIWAPGLPLSAETFVADYYQK